MANLLRGECTLEVGSKQYKLVFDQNAICEMEDALNEPFSRCATRWSNQEFAFREIRAMLWAGLREHHPRVTLKQCGEIMGMLGLPEVIGRVLPAFNGAFPKVEPGTDEPAEGNATADDGTGTAA